MNTQKPTPKWLVFPDVIINTKNIIGIQYNAEYLYFKCREGVSYTIKVSDVEKTWKGLREVFTNGVSA